MDVLLIAITLTSVSTLIASLVLAMRSFTDDKRAIRAAKRARETTDALERTVRDLTSQFADLVADTDAVKSVGGPSARVRAAHSLAQRRTGLWDASQRTRVLHEAAYRGAITADDADYLVHVARIEAVERSVKNGAPYSENTSVPGDSSAKYLVTHAVSPA